MGLECLDCPAPPERGTALVLRSVYRAKAEGRAKGACNEETTLAVNDHRLPVSMRITIYIMPQLAH